MQLILISELLKWMLDLLLFSFYISKRRVRTESAGGIRRSGELCQKRIRRSETWKKYKRKYFLINKNKNTIHNYFTYKRHKERENIYISPT